MSQLKELKLDDFKTVEMPGGQYYLSCVVGDWEITLEPHLVVGYTISIYEKKSTWLAVEKRAAYLRNHPLSEVPKDIPSKVIERAISYANQLFQKHVLLISPPTIHKEYAGE